MAGMLLPEFVNGAPTWMEEADPEFVRQLQEGDPSIGWEGDPRLYIRKNLHTGGWTVWRFGEDQVEYAICHSRPNANGKHVMDKSLFIKLIENDTRRGSVTAKVEAHNARVQRDQDQKDHSAAMEKMEKVYWGAAKDLGHIS